MTTVERSFEMREKELRRSLSVLPMGTVMKLTGLSARQIRYYEQRGLIDPKRSQGNRRLYSLKDVDRLLDIKDYLNAGLDVNQIKKVYLKVRQKHHNDVNGVSDNEARRLLEKQLMDAGGLDEPDLTSNHPYPL